METLCKIRDIYRSISDFQDKFQEKFGLCFNEGMVLCSLSDTDHLSSGEIAILLGLKTANASKVIRSVEEKKLIHRVLGTKDKRQMYFSLTPAGKKRIDSIKCTELEIPDLIKNIL